MSDRYKGAILSPTAPTVTPQSAGGIYTSSQQLQYQGQGVWPSAVNYPINNSLRFRQSASAYLTRTPSVSGSGTTFTWSGWVKRGLLGGSNVLTVFTAGTADAALGALYFDNSTNKLSFLHYNGAYNWNIVGTPAYRDPSAWYHVVAVVNTTQATASNRIRLYVNGVEITAFDTASYPTQNYSSPFFNQSGIAQFIGRWGTWNAGNIFDGYLAEVNFIDGTALTPSSFGTIDAYGIWQPIPYTGAYGTNGFYLPFRLNSTSSFYGSFNGSSQYLSTTSGITNQFTPTSGFTLEMWLNPSNTNTAQVFYVGGGSNNWNTTNGLLFGLLLGSGGNYQWQWNNAGSTFTLSFPDLPTNQWSHVAIGYNGTTTRIWVNGVSAGTSTNPYTVPTTVNQYVIGSNFGGAANFYSGQLSNLRFVKGTDVYGVANANISVPISPLTAIANTQLLTLQNSTIIDNSTNAFSITNNGSVTTTATTNIFALPTISSDYSGNNNNWTPNNISLTPGSTYDSMKDVPTNTNSNTASYAVLNPLIPVTTTTIINGNLGLSGYNAGGSVFGTMGVSSGKWYFEYIAYADAMGGISGTPNGGAFPGAAANAYTWDSNNATKYSNNTGASYGSATSNGDIVGVAFDLDSGSITFYKNNVSQGTAYTFTPSGSYFPAFRNGSSTNTSVNFGQRPFAYTPPSGFYPLNTYNLPTPTILDGDQYFDVNLWTGNGTSTGNTQVITNAGGFQPDFVWIKARNTSTPFHILNDSVRGTNKILYSNSTDAENSVSNVFNSFNSNGFTVAYNSSFQQTVTNENGQTYVGWQWRASNAAGVSNTQGTITSTVSANTTSGFSIATFTCPSSGNFTVGHGLGVAPAMFILKTRSAVDGWYVYHQSLSTPASNYLTLNATSAVASSTSIWGNTNPTSTVLTLGTNAGIAANQTGVLYCFAQVAGYSAFGTWQNNNSTDGTFVYLGFRPRFIMLKNSDNVERWFIQDSARQPYNYGPATSNYLVPNSSASEGTNGADTACIDFLSNGFKIRTTNPAAGEISFGTRTYIYACFAESPFKISRAR